jgi:hypothetical protein
LGWGTIQGEINKNKTRFWNKIMTGKKDTWPAAIMREILGGEFTSQWYIQTCESRSRLQPHGYGGGRPSKQTIQRGWVRQETQVWCNEKEQKPSMKYYPQVMERYANKTAASSFFCKLRIGDTHQLKEGDGRCKICRKEYKRATYHAIFECHKLIVLERDETDPTELLTKTTDENIKAVYRQWNLWKKRQQIQK